MNKASSAKQPFQVYPLGDDAEPTRQPKTKKESHVGRHRANVIGGAALLALAAKGAVDIATGVLGNASAQQAVINEIPKFSQLNEASTFTPQQLSADHLTTWVVKPGENTPILVAEAMHAKNTSIVAQEVMSQTGALGVELPQEKAGQVVVVPDNQLKP